MLDRIQTDSMEDVIEEKQQGAPVMEVEETISVNDRKSPF